MHLQHSLRTTKVRPVDVSAEKHYILGRRDGLQLEVGVSVELCTASASRRHAVVAHDGGGGTYVQDLRSTNGTFMNGHRMEPKIWYPWKVGATVTFGIPGVDCEGATLVLSQTVPLTSEEAISAGLPTCVLKRGRDELLHVCDSAVTLRAGDGAMAASASADAATKRRRCSQVGAVSMQLHPASINSVPACRPELQLFPPVPQKPQRHEDRALLLAKQALVTASKPAVQEANQKKCDKCDGPHPTDVCPHFRKPRETHKDAWANYGNKSPLHMGGAGGNFVLRNARMVPQPGDGSCLFHSLCYGLNAASRDAGARASALRREVANFIARHPKLEIAGDTIEEWVRWDANTTCGKYANRMASGGWGGGIEMAACSLLKRINVHVYERQRSGQFKRISCFNHPSAPKASTVHVLYQGRMHYDALAVT